MTSRRKLLIAVASPLLLLVAVGAWLAWYKMARTGVRQMPLLAREPASASAGGAYGLSVNVERGRCFVTTDREVIVYVVGGGFGPKDHGAVRCYFKAGGERYPSMQTLTFRVTGKVCLECKGFEREGAYASHADFLAQRQHVMAVAAAENPAE